MVHLKRTCFGILLIERGIITREARLFWYLAYKTRNITVEACLFRLMANITRNLRSVSIKHTDRHDP